jgi:hypothetical protein
MTNWATRLSMCRKLKSQIKATSVSTIHTISQIDHDEQIKPQQDESVPKGGAVAGGNRCAVILWISHNNRGRTSVDVVVQSRLLTDKRRIHLRSASIRTYTFFTTGFPRFLSIRGARGLQAFDLPLHNNYSNPNYD